MKGNNSVSELASLLLSPRKVAARGECNFRKLFHGQFRFQIGITEVFEIKLAS